MDVKDNLDFFKKSFFSRQKNKKIFENLNTIESITTISTNSQTNNQSNNKTFSNNESEEEIKNQKEMKKVTSDRNMPTIKSINWKNKESTLSNCFKKVYF